MSQLTLQEESNKILRQITYERLILKRPANHTVMAARIIGPFPFSHLHSALEMMRKIHPLLGSRITFDEDNIGWFTTDNVPDIEIEVIQSRKQSDWMECMAAEQKHVFDIEKGPLCRLILLTSDNYNDIVINCHHSISDGLSVVYFIRDLLQYLSNPNECNLIPKLPHRVIENSIQRKITSLRNRVLSKLIGTIWNQKGVSFTQNEFEELCREFWKSHNTHVTGWLADKALTDDLVDSSRKEKVTVHSALCTAFLIAQREIQNEQKPYHEKVHIPVNIRNRLKVPVVDAFGFYAAPIIVRLLSSVEKGFWNITHEYHKIIKSNLTDESVFRFLQVNMLPPTLIDSTYFSRFGMLDSKIASMLVKEMDIAGLFAGLSITNLGILNIPFQYGDLSLESLYGPSVYSDLIEKILGVNTIRGKLHFVFTFDSSIVSNSVIDDIRIRAMEILRDAVA